MRVLLCLLYLVCAAMPSTASYFDAGDIAKCVDGKEVSRNDCLAGAREVNPTALANVSHVFPVFDDDPGPCGCWIGTGYMTYAGFSGYITLAFFKDPDSGECNALNPNPGSVPSANVVCQHPTLNPVPSSTPSLDPSGTPSSALSSIPSDVPSNAPSSSPSFESVSHEMCGNFAVHARTTVTFAGVTSTIQDGDVGVYPGTSITGSHLFVNGGDIVLNSTAFADHVVDSHASAMEGNYGTSETAMEIEIGGMTFLPGIYRSGSAINFAHSTVVTLDGNNEANPEFIFIAGSTLVTAADTYFDLKNGAKAENVVWVLGTAATLGAGSHVAGSIMAGTAITFGTNSKLYGCALAQTAVTFESGGSVAIDHYEDDALITV